MPKFFAYGRHSTDKQGITEEVQKEILTKYFEFKLKPMGVEWGGFFYDAAVSAGKPMTERPKGMALWTSAQPGDHVGWSKIDRAFRRVSDGLTTMELFKSKGITVHSIDLGLDTSTDMGKCILTIMLAFAELERSFVSSRTKDALAQRRANGIPHAAATPIGWRWIGRGKTRELLVNQAERDDVSQWYWEYYHRGASIESLVVQARHEGKVRGRTHWHVRTIRRAFVALESGWPPTNVSDKNFRRKKTLRQVC